MAKKGQRFKEYTYETKLQVVKEYLSGTSKKEVLERYNVKSISQVESWTRLFLESGESGLKPRKRGRTKRAKEQTEIERLRMENDILKKIQELLDQEQR